MQHHQKQTARQRYFRRPKVQQWNGLINLRVADDGECVLFAVVRESETGPFAVTQYAPFLGKTRQQAGATATAGARATAARA
jgi:hypothetical protein